MLLSRATPGRASTEKAGAVPTSPAANPYEAASGERDTQIAEKPPPGLRRFVTCPW
jgi:hypothetical protein